MKRDDCSDVNVNAVGLTKAERNELATLGWATYWFDGYCPIRSNKALRSIIAKGLVRELGMVNLCDGDGFSETRKDGSEIMRAGYTLTDDGVEATDPYWRDKIKKEGRRHV